MKNWPESQSFVSQDFLPVSISISFCIRHERVFVAQSCPTLCDSMDRNPPGASVHGVPQVGIFQWVAISFSRDWIWVFLHGRQTLYHLCHQGSPYENLFFFFGHIMWLVGFLVPWLGIELGPSAVKAQVLTTGLPGNSQEAFFFHWISIFHVAYYRILNLVPNIIDTEYSSLLYSRPLLFIYPINTSLHLRVPYYQSILGNHKPVLCLWVYFCFVDRFICAIV